MNELKLKTDRRALIPRPETEALLEWLVYTLVPRAGALAGSARPKPRGRAPAAGQPSPAAPSAPATDNIVLDLTWRAQHGEE